MTIEELYPELNEKELREAEYNLRRYFEIAAKIALDASKPASEKRGREASRSG